MSLNKYLVVIAGPTAVGKTKLSIELAKHYHSAILSADSRQIYKELTIGTAKPSEQQLNEVPHYFINTKSIQDHYTVGHYEKDVRETLDVLFKKYNVLFLIGGSGLYINAVLNGIDHFVDVPIEVRENLKNQYSNNGIEWLQLKLKQLDYISYQTIDLKNPQRLIRAIEVCEHAGKPYSSFLNQKNNTLNFIPIKIVIDTNRNQLYNQIDHRVENMMTSGLLNEVKNLISQKHLNTLKTVGYTELFDFFDDKYTLKTAVEKIKQHTRNYAKRQLTWFKNQNQFKTFEPTEFEKIKTFIDSTKREEKC